MKTKHTALLEWLKSAADEDIQVTKTTRAYLRMIAYGYKTASAEMAAGIERATNGAVTRQLLRPDDWKQIWPELAA